MSNSHIFWKKLSPPISMPKSLPSWLEMIMRAAPIIKPIRMGPDTKSARKPTRAIPAARATPPTSRTSSAGQFSIGHPLRDENGEDGGPRDQIRSQPASLVGACCPDPRHHHFNNTQGFAQWFVHGSVLSASTILYLSLGCSQR